MMPVEVFSQFPGQQLVRVSQYLPPVTIDFTCLKKFFPEESFSCRTYCSSRLCVRLDDFPVIPLKKSAFIVCKKVVGFPGHPDQGERQQDGPILFRVKPELYVEAVPAISGK
jgi:hypothetical protein